MNGARDKNGKTEEQFLRDYDVTRYFRPSVTVDAVLYMPTGRGARMLMIKRGGHPFIGMYAFPGGFVEEDESCETAVCRELAEETGITGVGLSQLVTVSTPGRDPRWRNITAVFCARVSAELEATGGDDAAEAVWFDVERTEHNGLTELRFSADGRESFTAKLRLARDHAGAIDLNGTVIEDRGGTAFDHAKVICYLLDKVRGD